MADRTASQFGLNWAQLQPTPTLEPAGIGEAISWKTGGSSFPWESILLGKRQREVLGNRDIT